MPVLNDINIELDTDKILASFKGRNAFSHMKDKILAACDHAMSIIDPKAVYEWGHIEGIENNSLLINSGGEKNTLRIGEMVSLLGDAKKVLIGVVTIGDKIEQKVKEFNRDKDILSAYFLDTVGVFLLDQASQILRRESEKKARERGWGVSPSFSPGSLRGWDITEQRALCSILPIRKIGVSLGESCVLTPFKSASELIGIGPLYKSHEVGESCRYCAHKNNCTYRRERREKDS